MNILLIFAVAAGLAMDAFAVSVSAGTYEKSGKLNTAIKLAVVFGGFQALMYLAGWLAGSEFSALISQYDHWIAFILLLAIGLKMVYESFSESEERKFDVTAPLMLIFLGIATSIDSLAVGVSFAFLDTDIITPAVIIGAVTFILSFAGVYIGNKFGGIIGRRAELAGGIVLILIGLKILAEGLFY